MRLNRIRVCQEVDQRLRHLKARTGVTPNLLCRLGFCLSLNEPSIPDPDAYPEDSEREFNRYTLTGQWDSLFAALLAQRLHQDGLDMQAEFERHFKAHLNRGVLLLYQRVKTLTDLGHLVQETVLAEIVPPVVES